MVEDVQPSRFANVEPLSKFAEHLVPRPADITAQKMPKRPEDVGKPLMVVAILASASRRSEFRLIVIIAVGNEGKPLAPLATLASAPVALALDDDFVHVFTHAYFPSHPTA